LSYGIDNPNIIQLKVTQTILVKLLELLKIKPLEYERPEEEKSSGSSN
jgi:hypothetical protein